MSTTPIAKVSILFLVAAIASLGCSEGEAKKCVAGKTAACACANGPDGTQTCTAKGTYAACDCPAPSSAGKVVAGEPPSKAAKQAPREALPAKQAPSKALPAPATKLHPIHLNSQSEFPGVLDAPAGAKLDCFKSKGLDGLPVDSCFIDAGGVRITIDEAETKPERLATVKSSLKVSATNLVGEKKTEDGYALAFREGDKFIVLGHYSSLTCGATVESEADASLAFAVCSSYFDNSEDLEELRKAHDIGENAP